MGYFAMEQYYDTLKHYGVKGMKWGVRHDRERGEKRKFNWKKAAAIAGGVGLLGAGGYYLYKRAKRGGGSVGAPIGLATPGGGTNFKGGAFKFGKGLSISNGRSNKSLNFLNKDRKLLTYNGPLINRTNGPKYNTRKYASSNDALDSIKQKRRRYNSIHSVILRERHKRVDAATDRYNKAMDALLDRSGNYDKAYLSRAAKHIKENTIGKFNANSMNKYAIRKR